MSTTDRPDLEFLIPAEEDERELRFRPADPAAARTLTAEQVERYNAEGYLNALPLFDVDEAARVRAYMDDLLDKVVNADDRRNSYSINMYQVVCQGLYDLIQTPRLLDLVQDIVGPDIVCWGSQVFCKLPGDPKEVPLHQDATYWPFTPTRSVTVWIAIDDADDENAAMRFAPGSHLLGPLPHDVHALDGTRLLKRQVRDPEQYGDQVTNVLRAGEMSFHSDLLLHGSAANLSNRRRAGLTIRYFAGEVRALDGWESWLAPSIHCRGDIPDHWPNRRRPDGEHPERMAAFTGIFDGNPPDAG